MLYSSTLESYVSVLSSISSHILHSIFYEVIIPQIKQQEKYQSIQNSNIEVKLFAIKIAEKIITICQGDLVLDTELLSFLIQ